MSRRTQEKENRRVVVQINKDKKNPVYATIGYRRPEERKLIAVSYKGVEMHELVAKGQVINPRKAYKRFLKKRPAVSQ